jgi:GntR family transcriptional regulator, transcriptional repressor for pyruvate dehydrogenase complex
MASFIAWPESERRSLAVELAKAHGGRVLEFAPIQQLRAHEYVAEQVRRHIALRLVAPGESLPSERELASTFGVGRPTVQRALRLLEADHLVQARRGRRGGTFVSEPTESAGAMDELLARVVGQRKELEEVLSYRRAIEPRVAGEAARSRRRPDLTAMSRAIAGMGEAGSESDYMRHDTEFHLAVARATRNRFMVGAIEDVRLRLNDAMSLLPESDTWHRRLGGEHDAIMAAIVSRDAQAAERAMSHHVAASDLSVRAVLAAIGRKLPK